MQPNENVVFMNNKCLLKLNKCHRKVTCFKVQKLPAKSPLTGNFYSGLTID